MTESLLTITSTATLNDGSAMPLLGLGVWQTPSGPATVQAVTDALAAGYRHIDTAKFYRNESSVGQAVNAAKERGITDIWVTTKLFPIDAIRVNSAFRESFEKLSLDVIDCYLVHFPPPGLVTKTWNAMEGLLKTGRCRTIGVSNHGIKHLEAIRKSCAVTPAVNQIELHPFRYSAEIKELVSYCEAHGIAVEAYSPLTRGRHLGDPALVEIATAHGKSPAQVLIRWCLEHRFIVIPKSVHKERIVENADVFDFSLTGEEMERLDSLG